MPALRYGASAKILCALLFSICIGPLAHAAGEDGAAIYRQNCAMCHQPEGQGLPPVYPALRGGAIVSGDAAELARIIIDGQGAMPSFRRGLNAEQITAVSNYLRGSWGNDAPKLDVGLVRQTLDQDNQEEGTDRGADF